MAALDLETLTRPLPAWSPKALCFSAMRRLIATVGRRSRGIRIGLEHGFDSGVMLDYVYDNRPSGDGFIGRLIDRVYLNAPGWKGIRNRGVLVEAAIAEAIAEIAAREGSVRMADLACGGGRYALDALKRSRASAVEATLRDYRPENVAKAKANAVKSALEVTVETADAFSDADLARLGERDLVIVSGLHEIIPDDTLIENHFRQIARVLVAGGLLIVTVQPDHPQAEFIARVLRSHTGRPWAMRFRPVDLIRRWLAEAGFAVESLTMENTGIFGVIRARKV